MLDGSRPVFMMDSSGSSKNVGSRLVFTENNDCLRPRPLAPEPPPEPPMMATVVVSGYRRFSPVSFADAAAAVVNEVNEKRGEARAPPFFELSLLLLLAAAAAVVPSPAPLSSDWLRMRVRKKS